MNMKTLEEMIEAYLKSVNKYQLDGDFIEHNEHGFITFSFVGDVMVLPDLYGDGKHWLNRALEIAKENNCTRLRGGTSRNIKAYCRMFGLHVVGYVVEREV